MKKIPALAAAVMVLAPLVAGCASSTKSTKSAVIPKPATTAPTTAAPTTAAPTTAAPTTAAPTTAPPTTPPPTTAAPTTPAVSAEQENATRAAQNYLRLGSGFSRLGLIHQLSSSVADNYPLAVATAAVDSLGIDYNAQAALAAKKYLQVSPFSCAGLVQQLSSSVADEFTVAQAQYGAKAAGIC